MSQLASAVPPPDAPDGPRRAPRARVAAAVAYSAALAVWLLVRPASEATVLAVNAAACALGPLIGCWWCRPPLLRWLRERRGATAPAAGVVRPGAWLLMGAGLAMWAACQVAYYYYEQVLREPPFRSVAGVFYLLGYPCFFAGIMLLPSKRLSGWDRSRVLLDTLITLGCLAAFYWYGLLGPIVIHADSWADVALATIYPLGDLLIVFGLFFRQGRGRSPRTMLAPLTAGLLLVLLIDPIFAYGQLRGTWVSATLLDPLWPLAYMLLGAGIASARDLPGEPCEAAPKPRATPADHALNSWTPYVVTMLAGALPLAIELVGIGGPLAIGTYLLAAAVVVLVLIRQVVTIAENRRLNARLLDTLEQLKVNHAWLTQTLATARQSEGRFRQIFEDGPIGMAVAGLDHRLTRVNAALCLMLGYDEASMLSKSFAELTHPDDLEITRGRLAELMSGRTERYTIDKRYLTRSGEPLWVTTTASIMRDAHGAPQNVLVMVQDITDRRRAEDSLRHRSTHDPLTGLPNRALFTQRVEACLERCGESDCRGFAVMFLDLDRFKVVNDSLGHAAGDALLVNAARRLGTLLRARPAGPGVAGSVGGDLSCTVARLGGDEFAVLVEGTDDARRLADVAERIQGELRLPVPADGNEIVTSASIGIAAGSPRYATAAELMRDADAAMYAAKAAGRARHALFDAALHAAAITRLRLEGSLRRAIERREPTLAFQPILTLESGALVGFEALSRWHPQGVAVPPDEFIPIAEETGLIVPLGAQVLEDACRQLLAWAQGPAALRTASLSVNVSRRQLIDPELVPRLRRVLAATAVDPRRLKIEITESVLMADAEVALPTLRAIRDLGVGLHMDDFGAGYSSLSCLHRFPIDAIKIDRSVIASLQARKDYAAVIYAIVELAHNLNMRVVAEGLETAEQVAMLQALDCDLGQGHFFAQPMTAAEAERFAIARRELARSA